MRRTTLSLTFLFLWGNSCAVEDAPAEQTVDETVDTVMDTTRDSEVPPPDEIPVDTDFPNFCPASLGIPDMPWTGCWKEIAYIDCESGEQVAPFYPIGELRLVSDGELTVTWVPFESYIDYFGTYQVDEINGTIRIDAEERNYLPSDIDGEGRYAVTVEENLLLRDMWLGSAQSQKTEMIPCGQVFERLVYNQ